MRWLHRLLDYGQQLLTQGCQVRLLTQGGTESCHDAGGIVLAAVEAAINDLLDALVGPK